MREVYFVEGAGLIKIGFAADATRRFKAMLTGSPVPLSLLASMSGGPEVEAELHIQFAEWRAHGEWFRPSPKLLEIIAAAPYQYGQAYRDVLALPRANVIRASAARNFQ